MNRLQKREAVFPKCKQVTIPEVCMYLRMAVNGSSDPWPPAEEEAAVRFLRVCLETWEPSACPRDARFDAAVRELVEATLAEVDRMKGVGK